MSADTVWLIAYERGGYMILDRRGPEVSSDLWSRLDGHTAPGLYRVTWPAWDGWGDEPAPIVERVGDLPTLTSVLGDAAVQSEPGSHYPIAGWRVVSDVP